MKDPSEWDEDYVINLPPGEHDWLEFKSAEKLDFSLPKVDRNPVLSELSKQASAFANTGGGTIIYGIEDTSAGAVRQVDKHGGVSINLTRQGTKDWLEDVIPNLVDLPLARFNVYTILKSPSGSSIATDKAIFLIHIPSSEAAPHQANDNKYYARVSGKSRPVGHRLVLDIMGRTKHAKMDIEFYFEKEEKVRGISKSLLGCYFNNIGQVYANYVNAFISIPKAFVESSDSDGVDVDIDGQNYKRFYFANIWKDYLGSEGSSLYSFPKYITRYDPVLPKRKFFKSIVLKDEMESVKIKEHAEEWIYWVVYADSAPPIEGKTRIGDIKIED